MIELDDMDTTVEELESYTKCGKSKIRRLDEDHDRSYWKGSELIFDRFYLRINLFLHFLSLRRMIRSPKQCNCEGRKQSMSLLLLSFLFLLSFLRSENLSLSFLFFTLKRSIRSSFYLQNLMMIESESLIFFDIM